MLDIGYLAAFLGGVAALVSPCSALLLPSFFAYAFSGRTRLLARTGAFYLGLAAVLVPLGAGSGALATLVTEHRVGLIMAAGWLIVGLGVVQMFGGGWGVGPAARFQRRMAARGTWVSTIGVGAAYGLAGFCSGPILGAVLTVAAAGADPIRGAVLLAVYALGMAAPLFVLAALWERFGLGHRKWLRGRAYAVGPLRLHTTSTMSGLLFVAIGILFLRFGGTTGLLAPDPNLDQNVEDFLSSVASHVSDATVIGVLAGIVVLVVVVRLRRSTRRSMTEDAPDETSSVS